MKHSIDRIDNSKGYFKDNCRWATQSQQSRNTTCNVLITIDGETLCMTEWAERVGMKLGTLWRRIAVLKWDPFLAVTVPLRGYLRDPKTGRLNGREGLP